MTIATNKWPPKALQNSVVTCYARFAGGGAAGDMTLVEGGRNIASVAYNAATGNYLITFNEVGEHFLGGTLHVLSAAGTTTAYVAHPVAYSASDKSLSVYVSDVATPTAHDLSTSEELWITASWADSDAP